MDTPSPYQEQERYPATPQHHHTVIRTYPSPVEFQNANGKMERGWPHLRPNSVLLASMSNHWKGNSWAKVMDMIEHTNKAGIYCAFSEIQDRCFDPYDALGTMRNEAVMQAVGEGFEYICYIDNDIQPDPDMLIRLLKWQLPIVAPFVAEPGTGNGLHGPKLQPNSGLQPAKWTVLSMVLFNTSVFRHFGASFWEDAIGADEGYHFQKLWVYGYRLYVDTATQLVVGGRPLYPLALNRLSSGSMAEVEKESSVVATKLVSILGAKGMVLGEAERLELAHSLTALIRASKGERAIKLQEKIERFVQVPDRRPLDPNDKRVKDGEYVPFLFRADQAQPSGTAAPSANGVALAGVSAQAWS